MRWGSGASWILLGQAILSGSGATGCPAGSAKAGWGGCTLALRRPSGRGQGHPSRHASDQQFRERSRGKSRRRAGRGLPHSVLVDADPAPIRWMVTATWPLTGGYGPRGRAAVRRPDRTLAPGSRRAGRDPRLRPGPPGPEASNVTWPRGPRISTSGSPGGRVQCDDHRRGRRGHLDYMSLSRSRAMSPGRRSEYPRWPHAGLRRDWPLLFGDDPSRWWWTGTSASRRSWTGGSEFTGASAIGVCLGDRLATYPARAPS